MNPSRRLLLSALGAATLLPTSPLRAKTEHGSQLPSRITILVGFPPGGGTDVLARQLAAGLNEELGLPVVVLNRPGAGGQIAAQALKQSKPDGSVLFLSHDHTISILPQLNKDAGYDPAADFQAVAGIGNFVNCFVIAANIAPASYVQYRQWVVQQTATLRTVGIPAIASTPEYLVKRLNRQDRLDVAPIAYQGSAPMLGDILAGHIPAAIGSIFECMEHHRSGKIRIVAIMGSKKLALIPDVPTFLELGIQGFERKPYYGLFAPQGIPLRTRDTIALATKNVLGQSKFVELFGSSGIEINWSAAPQFSQEVLRYTQDWQKIFQESQTAS